MFELLLPCMELVKRCQEGNIIRICSNASHYVAYLWLDRLLGVIPGIVDVIEVIYSIVVCTAHMVDLQFI